MCSGITGYGRPKQFTGSRRWNHVLQHHVASTQCRLDLPRSPEFPVSHAYRRITVWMSHGVMLTNR